MIDGFGVPISEAAGCSVPIAAVNYSAMEDLVRLTHGFPLKVQKMFLELETSAMRAYPNNHHCAEVIEKYLTSSEEYKKKKQRQARQAVEDIFNWDAVAKTWEEYFDCAQLINKQGKWDSPYIQYNQPPPNPPPNLSNLDFIKWIYYELLQEPTKMHSIKGLEILKDLNYGLIDQNQAYNFYKTLMEGKIIAEKARTGQVPLSPQDYIMYANKRHRNG